MGPEKRKSRYRLLGTAALLLVLGGVAAEAQGKGRYSDGEFAGAAADTNWGPVQVTAIVRDGTLTDIKFVQYPWHRRRSEEISNWSLPAMKSEAIRTQSARVNIISGATLTAYGFRESLASALNQAGS